MRTKVFMTSGWEDLIISTYEVDKSILEKYLPNQTELDLYKGKALISLVAFTFSKVNFFGFKIPFHQQFGQINFRFYVKSKIDGKRGVVFIREFAPKPLMAFVANKFYNEPYYYKNIRRKKWESKNKISLEYSYKDISITANAEKSTLVLKENTPQHFIVDRYIAFVRSAGTKTYQYKIEHKPWKLYITNTINVNQKVISLLPNELQNLKLFSTYFVEGSDVKVEKGILQQEKKEMLVHI